MENRIKFFVSNDNSNNKIAESKTEVDNNIGAASTKDSKSNNDKSDVGITQEEPREILFKKKFMVNKE